MQVLGLCRFSNPAGGVFQRLHKTVKERCVYLYDPVRLGARFNSFKTIALPSIRGQADKDFRFLRLVGNTLPTALKEWLLEMTADVQKVEIIKKQIRPYQQVAQEFINSTRDPKPLLCAQFRLDDDNAACVEFVEDVKTVSERAHGLLEYNGKFAVDFNSEFAATASAEGLKTTLVQR
jgi:hypothetical protein